MSELPPRPCPRCRYELRPQLTGPDVTCPECGTTFTRDAVLSFDPRWRPRKILTLLLTTPIVMAAAGAFAALAVHLLDTDYMMMPLVALGCGFLWAFVIEIQLMSRPVGRPSPRFLIVGEALGYAIVVTIASGIVLVVVLGLLASLW